MLLLQIWPTIFSDGPKIFLLLVEPIPVPVSKGYPKIGCQRSKRPGKRYVRPTNNKGTPHNAWKGKNWGDCSLLRPPRPVAGMYRALPMKWAWANLQGF